MYKENLKQSQVDFIVSTTAQVQHEAVFGELKQFVLEAYENALLSEMFVSTPQQAHENFFMFKQLYNLLLKFEMCFDPELTGVNTL